MTDERGPWDDFAAQTDGLDEAGPWNDFAAPAKPEMTIGGAVKEAGLKALRELGGEAQTAGKAISAGTLKGLEPAKPDESDIGRLLQQPITLPLNPAQLGAHVAYGLTKSAPALALGAVGTAGGGAVAGPPGALLGGAGGFGVGSALQTVIPAYQKGIAEGLDHEAAVDRAIKETAIAGGFGAAAGLAPGVSIFGKTAEGAIRKPISEALAQIFGVQPGIMAGQRAAENVVEGRPVTEGTAESAALGALTGVPLVAMHAGGRAIKRAVMPERPSSTPEIDAFLRAVGEEEARAAGKQTRAEIDEFIRRKAAYDQQVGTPRLPGPGGAAEAEGPLPPEPTPFWPTAEDIPPDQRAPRPPEEPVGAGYRKAMAEMEALRNAGWRDEEIGLMGAKERESELKAAGYEPPVETVEPGSRQAPVTVEAPQDIEPARARVNTEPTLAQIEAGNYRKGHIKFDGFDISIENPRGSIRRGVDPDGAAWESPPMPGDYGYIKRTGDNTGEQVDVYLGDKPTGKVFVIDQNDLKTGAFDEPKVIMGVTSPGEAARLYHSAFSDGRGINRIGAITEMDRTQFKEWLKSEAPSGQTAGPWRDFQPAAVESGQTPSVQPESYEPTPVSQPAGTVAEPPATPQKPAGQATGPARPAKPQKEPAPQSLVAFLRAAGGIKDASGDLRARDVHRRFPGLVNNKTGMSLDMARQKAAEAGYLGGNIDEAMAATTPNDLLNAIEDGGKRYSVHDQERLHQIETEKLVKEREAAHKEASREIREELSGLGLSTDEDHISDAAHVMIDDRATWSEALEIAALRKIAADEEMRAAIEAAAPDAIPWSDYEAQELVHEVPEVYAEGVPHETKAEAPAASEAGQRDKGRPKPPAEGAKPVKEGGAVGERPPPAPAPGAKEVTGKIQAADTGEAMEIRLTPKGPWDFNDTFPEPDADKVAGLEAEGRYVVGEEGGHTAEQVASIFDEAIETEFGPAWRAIISGTRALPGIRAGKGKPPKRGMTHADWAKAVKKEIDAAKQHIRDYQAALEEQFSEEAAQAAVAESRRRELQRRKTTGPEPTPGKTEIQPKAAEATIPKPSGKVAATEPEESADDTLAQAAKDIAAGKGNADLLDGVTSPAAAEKFLTERGWTPFMYGKAKTPWFMSPDGKGYGFTSSSVEGNSQQFQWSPWNENVPKPPPAAPVAQQPHVEASPEAPGITMEGAPERITKRSVALRHEWAGREGQWRVVAKREKPYAVEDAFGATPDEAWENVVRKLTPKPTYEPGAEGKPQAVIPGAEQAKPKTMADLKAKAPMRPTVPQKGAGGMFDEGETAEQLFDKPPAPSEQFGNYAKWIKEGGEDSPGLREQIAMDERLDDGESGQLLKMLDAREKAPGVSDFAKALEGTRATGTPAAKGPDGRGWRIKKEGDGFIVMRLPPRDGTTGKPPSGEPPNYYRPETGHWTLEQAVAEGERLAREKTPPISPSPPSGPRQGEPGMMLAAGEVVLTATGRHTTPFPRVDVTSERKSLKTIQRVDRWLMENAALEADMRGDSFNAQIFHANKDKPSQADKDSAEFYLFDKESVRPVPEDILKPLVEISPETSGERVNPLKSPVEALRDHLLDHNAEPFKTIVQARKFMRERGFEPAEGIPENKQIEEAIEHAIVLAAREIVARGEVAGAGPGKTFEKLLGLYNRQPILGSRTSASIAEQAYSTPAPLAYVASRLAGIGPKTRVLEPTAGNGMLLMAADPKNAVVNELNPTRARALDAQGFSPIMADAADPAAFALQKGKMEVVIANPPFGAVKEGGQSKTFDVDGWSTTQIDHAIALNALKAMAPDGRAVLIVGGVKAESQEERAKGYQSAPKRRFFYKLLNEYKVKDIFTVDGDLYQKQGAGWPVDVIVIEGRGKTDRAPLTKEPPRLLRDWGQVKEELVNGRAVEPGEVPVEGGKPPIGAPETRPEPKADNVTGGEHAVRGEPSDGLPGQVEPQQLGVESDRGQPGDVRDRGAVGDRARPAAGVRQQRPRIDYVPDSERRRPVAANEAGQSTYLPASERGAPLDTLVPANLRQAIESSLDRVQRQYGHVDQFVADELDYDREELGKYFSAEQVDAIALGIANIKNGGALILGDQTGIGKGRVVAGIIRYAHRQGMLPVFVTEKPDLYGDMWRDLHDIGWPEHLERPIEMFMTNSDTRVPLDEKAVEWVAQAEIAKANDEKPPPREGAFSLSQDSKKTKERMNEIVSGKGNKPPDVIFTTYDQMNSVKGEETSRRNFLRAVAPRAFLILDEAHNAGGQGEDARVNKSAAPPRSDLFREVVGKANAVMYSSATYAKSPKVMSLFSRTDMAKAVEKPSELPALLDRGGVPLQQIVSSTMAQAGQYMRREKSFAGISYEVEAAPVDEELYAGFTKALRAIFTFDRGFSDERAEIADGIVKELGAGNARDTGVGEAAAHSTQFSSIMHNAIGQMVLSIKSDAAANRAIAALKAGEKPVITLSSTMESFLKDVVDERGLNIGDDVDMSFKDVLRRYLTRTRRITIKMPDDSKKHVFLADDMLSGSTLRAFNEAVATVENANIQDLPISPIDAIRSKIEKAGYSVREITGRQTMIDYSGDVPVLAKRPSNEAGSSGKRVTIKAFNDGNLDVVILNRSGSTGVSMHASVKVKDQRPRRMILVQADPNIDTHMQTLGRVNRTGQVVLPAYTQLAADIPAEVRPTAVLMKKMASLNANTTAARKSKFTGEAVDFMNKYGDLIAARAMVDDFDTNAKLGFPVDFTDAPTTGEKAQGVMAKVTGRLTLLEPAEQQALIDKLTSDYKELIERLDAEGTNDLEAKSVDLQARVVDSQVIKPRTGPSPFQDEVRLDRVSVKSQGRAMAPAEILQFLSERGVSHNAKSLYDLRHYATMEWRNASKRAVAVAADSRKFVAERAAGLKKDEAKEKVIKESEANLAKFTTAAQTLYPTASVNIDWQGAKLPGIVIDFDRTGTAKNPAALSAWRVVIAIPDSARTISIPLSSLQIGGEAAEGMLRVEGARAEFDIDERFEAARKEGRETRYIFSGNLLAAFDQTKGRGQIITHTMEEGSSRAGILMRRGFSPADFMKSRAVRFKTGAQVLRYLGELPQAEATSTDGVITVRGAYRGAIEFDLPAAKAKGGVYYADKSVRAIYDAWEKKGSRMRAEVPADKAAKLIDAMMNLDAVFETSENQTRAEAIIAEMTPPEPKTYTSPAPSGWEAAGGGPPLPSIETGRRIVETVIKKVLPPESVRVHVAGDIQARGHEAAMLRHGVTDPRDFRPSGFYRPDDSLIALALNPHPAMRSTAFHEAWHAAEAMGLPTAQEMRALRSPAEVERMRKAIVKFRPNAYKMSEIELRAYAAQIYSAGRDRGVSTPRFHASSVKAFERFDDFLRRLRNALHGAGFQTPEDVFGRYYSGEMAKRPFYDRERNWLDDEERIEAERAASGGEGKTYASLGLDGGEEPQMHFADRSALSRLRERIPSLQELRSRAVENFADLNAPVKEFQEELYEASAGMGHNQPPEMMRREIPPNRDIYKAKRLLGGKTAALRQDFQKFYVDPLVEKAKAAGLTRQEISNWIFAKHVPERNAYIDEINPDVGGKGSGQTDEWAQAMIERLTREGKAGALANIESDVNLIREFILSTWEQSGLMSEEQTEALRRQYEHYVPLQGWEDPSMAPDEANELRPGGRMAIRGREIMAALGRSTVSDDPLANLINMAYRAIDRAEKNKALRVAWLFLRGLDKEVTKGVVSFDKSHAERLIDKETGLVVVRSRRMSPLSKWQDEDNVVPLKIGGKQHYMVFDDKRVAQSIMRLRADTLPVVFKQIGDTVNFAKSMWTHLNPEFVVRHFFARYPLEGFFNAGEDGVSAMFKAVRNGYPGGKAMRSILEHEKLSQEEREELAAKVSSGKATEQERWMAYYQEMRDEGGLMNFADFGGVERVRKRIGAAIAGIESYKTNPAKAALAYARLMHEWVNHITSAMDNAQRLAVYAQKREQGAHRIDAALAAREATIDFALRGRLSNWINMMWPFGTTEINTASRMIRGAKRSDRMKMVIGGLVAFGAASALYNYLMGGVDDDGKPYFEKLGDWVRHMNITLPTPLKDANSKPYFVSLPMPYNFSLPFTIGQASVGMAMRKAGYGKEDYTDIMRGVLHSGLEALTPFGQESTLLGKITPEIAKPLYHITINQNWHGGQLYPKEEPWNLGVPHAEQAMKNTSAFWKEVAHMGSKVGLDYYPEEYREVLDYFTSGFTRIGGRAMDAGSDVMAGKAPSATDIPLLHVFAAGGKQFDKADRAEYYKAREEAQGALNRAKQLEKKVRSGAAPVSEFTEFRRDNAGSIAAAKVFSETSGKLSKLHQQRDKVENSAMTPEQKQRALDILDAQEEKLRKAASRRAKTMMEKDQ